jgi:hypothetical protein
VCGGLLRRLEDTAGSASCSGKFDWIPPGHEGDGLLQRGLSRASVLSQIIARRELDTLVAMRQSITSGAHLQVYKAGISILVSDRCDGLSRSEEKNRSHNYPKRARVIRSNCDRGGFAV